MITNRGLAPALCVTRLVFHSAFQDSFSNDRGMIEKYAASQGHLLLCLALAIMQVKVVNSMLQYSKGRHRLSEANIKQAADPRQTQS